MAIDLQPSLSRILIRVSVQGKGDAEGEVFRHLAPITLNTLLRSMPINGRVNRFDNIFIYVISGVVAGVEKTKKVFQRGDIAFLALNGAICIFLKDSTVAKPMNPIGRITAGLEVLENTSPGDVLTIQQRVPSSPTP